MGDTTELILLSQQPASYRPYSESGGMILSSSQKKRKTWGLNKQSEEVVFLSANEQAAQHKFTRWKKGRGRRKMTWCAQNPLQVAGIHREMPTLLYKNNLLSFMCELHFCSRAADCIWRKTHNHTDWAPFKFMITNLKQDLVLPSNPTVCSLPSPMPLDENYVPLSSDLIFSLFLFLWENKCHQKSPCISTHHLYPPACPRTCIFCPLSWDYKRAMLLPKAKTCLCTLDQKHNSNNSTLSLSLLLTSPSPLDFYSWAYKHSPIKIFKASLESLLLSLPGTTAFLYSPLQQTAPWKSPISFFPLLLETTPIRFLSRSLHQDSSSKVITNKTEPTIRVSASLTRLSSSSQSWAPFLWLPGHHPLRSSCHSACSAQSPCLFPLYHPNL